MFAPLPAAGQEVGLRRAVPLLPEEHGEWVTRLDVVDLNGDQHEDLLLSGESRVYWYPREDEGFTFAAPVEIIRGTTYPADLDDDGDADLIVDDGSGELWVLLNDGSGNFSETLITENHIRWEGLVAIMDLDGDDDPDLLVAHRDGPQWRENDGAGGFSTHRSFALPDAWMGAQPADLDQDGDQDLLVYPKGQTTGDLAWHENLDGAGTFSEARLLYSAATKMQVAVADLNADEAPDLLLYMRHFPNTDAEEAYLGWFPGPWSATQAPTLQDINRDEKYFVNSIHLLDAGHDGDQDVLVVGRNDLRLYPNLGQGTFGEPIGQGFAGVQQHNNAAEIADLDQDGLTDVLLMQEKNLFWLQGDATPPGTPTNLMATGEGGQIRLEWEAPGDPDLWSYDVYRSEAGQPAQWRTRVKAPYRAYVDGLVSPGVSYSYTLAAVDAADNRSALGAPATAAALPPLLAIHSITPETGAPSVLLRDGTLVTLYGAGFGASRAALDVRFGTARATVWTATHNRLVVEVPAGLTGTVPVTVSLDGQTATAPVPFRILDADPEATHVRPARQHLPEGILTPWADLDSDGDLETLLLTTATVTADQTLARYQWHDGDWQQETVQLDHDAYRRLPTLGDFDGDGQLDLLVVEGQRVCTPAWYRNMGQGLVFTRQQELAPTTCWSPFQAVDLDGDGDADLLAEDLAWYENLDGAGHFGPRQLLEETADGIRSTTTGDLDGDGDLDVVTHEYGGGTLNASTARWYENQGTEGFEPHVLATDLAGYYPARTFIVDLDQDGDLDIVANFHPKQESRQLRWYENRDGAGTFSLPQQVASNVHPGNDYVVLDANGDALPDIATVASLSGTLLRFYLAERTDGAISYTEVDRYGTWGDEFRVPPADFDQDGDLDLFADEVIIHDTDAPATPTAFQATGGGGFVELTWAATADRDLFAYHIFRGTMAGTLDSLTTLYADTTVFRDAYVEPGQPYFYQIVAEDAAGLQSTPTPSASATPAAGPLILTGFSAASALPGAEINVYGRRLATATFTIGGKPAPVVAAQDHAARIEVPAGLAGLHAIRASLGSESAESLRRLTVLAADGPLQFEARQALFHSADGYAFSELHLADLNRDGTRDVVFQYGNRFCWWATTASMSTLEEEPCTPFPEDFLPTEAKLWGLADLDSDGDLDLMVENKNRPHWELGWHPYEADTFAAFQRLPVAYENTTLYGVGALTFDAHDVNHDGYLDLMIGSYVGSNSTGEGAWFKNTDGQGHFVRGGVLGETDYAYYLAYADLDEDLEREVVASLNNGSGLFSLERRVGSDAFEPPTPIETNEPHITQLVAVQDVDGDGLLDVLYDPASNTTPCIWLLNDRSEPFTTTITVPLDCYFFYRNSGTSPQFADLDADGDLDLVAKVFGEIAVYLLDAGAYAETPVASVAGEDRAFTVGDFDGDGDLDLLTAYADTVYLHRNQAIPVSTTQPEGLPTQFALAQNYPNPFNPTTTIRYALASPEAVRIDLYDVVGRRVRTLVEATQPAGWHTVTLDAHGLASGVYFYRMTAGRFSQTHTLLLHK